VPVGDGARDCRERCEQETADACEPRPEQDYKRGSVGLSPWAERILFARTERGELSLARDELEELWRDEGSDPAANLRACTERVGDWSRLLENPP
jgi:hypothetical protein